MFVVARSRYLAVHIDEARAKFCVGFFTAREANDLYPGRQLAIDGEVVECGDELAVGEVAAGPKDHQALRWDDPLLAEANAQWIGEDRTHR